MVPELKTGLVVKSRFANLIDKCYDNKLESFLVKDNVDLSIDGYPTIKPRHQVSNINSPRYVHVDLGFTDDRVGIAMVRYAGLKSVTRGDGEVDI